MPNGDRTGPAGAGAMSGRGAGYCEGIGPPGCYPMQSGDGRGMAHGRRKGRWAGLAAGGSGLRCGPRTNKLPHRTVPGCYPSAAPQLSTDLEKQHLRNRSRVLRSELEAIQQQLEELKRQETTS